MSDIGRILVIAGLGLAAVGALLWLLSRTSLPVGQLPGDFRFQVGGITCFVPLATMLILSLLATLAINIIVRLLNR